MGKINFEELELHEEQNILKTKAGIVGNARKADTEKLSAQVKVNLKPREKKQLERQAGRNMSAFIRDVLIEQGYIH